MRLSITATWGMQVPGQSQGRVFRVKIIDFELLPVFLAVNQVTCQDIDGWLQIEAIFGIWGSGRVEKTPGEGGPF